MFAKLIVISSGSHKKLTEETEPICMVLGDFHIHSKFSDGQLTISEIVDLYGQKGFDVIAITDHLCDRSSILGKAAHLLERTLTAKTFKSYLNEIKVQGERARRQYNMTVIPGVEITKNSFSHQHSAHILALGVNQWINPNLSIEKICEKINQQNAVSVAAHPVSTKKIEPQTYFLWNHRQYFCNHFDAWEVASGSHIFEPVAATHLPMLANSDFHLPRHMSSWKTVVTSANSSADILQGIKKQRVKFKYVH